MLEVPNPPIEQKEPHPTPTPISGYTYRSAGMITLIVIASIYAAELLVMFLLELLRPLPSWILPLIDSTLLVLFIYPMLHFFVFLPQRRQIREIATAMIALEEARDQVEQRVIERTAELQQANKELDASLRQLESRKREATLLAEMVNLFQACRNNEEAYTVLAHYASRLFPEVSGILYVFKASRNLLEKVVGWGENDASESTFEPGECWALRRGRIHLTTGDPTALNCEHLGTASPSASLCIPMVAQGNALGILLLRVADSSAPAAEQLAGYSTLAHTASEHISLALANLNLRESLHSQAIRDPLTGLFNRRYLEETLDRELHRAQRRGSHLCVLIVDVDHFKRFNDTHGHDAGDALLRELGATLRNQLRKEDVTCRYGGEEFVLVLMDADTSSACKRAEELRQAVQSMQVLYRGQPLEQVTISIGVAVFSDDGDSPEVLLKAADQALYRAKSSGRNRVVLASDKDSMDA